MLTEKTRAIIYKAIADIRATFLSLLIFNLILAGVSAILFTPLIAGLFRRLVASTGKNVLSDMEIAGFLLTPSGIAAVVLFLVVFLALTIFSSACFMQILMRQTRNARTAILVTLINTFGLLPRIALLIALIVGIALALALPFLAAIAYFALPLVTEYDINFYLAQKPPEFIRAVIIAGALLSVLLVIYIYLFSAWFLALPLLLFRGLSPWQSLKQSAQIVRGRRKKVGLIVLSWLLLVAVISATLGICGTWLISILMSFQTSLTITVFMMGIVMLINTLVTLAVSFITLISLNAVIIRIYLDLSGDSVETAEITVPKNGMLARVRQLSLPAWCGLGILVLIIAVGAAVLQLRQIDLSTDVLVIAHRGSSLAAPENTMAAINLAIEESSDFVEIDVQEDADGNIVVLHDADLKRVAGIDKAIADINHQDAGDIDIGSWFDSGYSAERLPLLENVLETAGNRAGVVIELKFTSRSINLAERVVSVVRNAGVQDSVEYMSLSYGGTQQIRQIDPDAVVGFLSNVSFGNLTDTNVDFLAVSTRTATRSMIARAHKANKRVYVWTVNTPREMALFIDRGVDGIITDAPLLLNQVKTQMDNATVVQRLLLKLGNEIGLELKQTVQ